jgi:UDP-N-acetylglucosamine 2-epimerase (non-hydrolysing)
MKVMTVLGTRPEIIRLSLVIPELDRHCDHVLVNTNQNFDPKLNDLFFEELGVRKADISFDSRAETAMGQVSNILREVEKELLRERPDRILILGDTNSGLAAFAAKRLGIEVYHMEAGNRCYDDRVPEEVNRRVIDHSSDVLMPYTERSRDNLIREGIPSERIFVTGNPIKEVLDHHSDEIGSSKVMGSLKVKKGGYFLVTLHRAENVDDKDRLKGFVKALNALAEAHDKKLVWSVHPRTKQKLQRLKATIDPRIMLSEPFGLFDFVRLEKNARCVLTDSGTVQEECCIFGVPNVTLRDVTERPETLEVGSNVLSGGSPERIVACVEKVLASKGTWSAPPEYLRSGVARTVTNIVLGHRHR